MVDVGEMPGTVLAREIAKRGWTQRELASIIKRPPGLISAIIRGKKCITTETARDLEAAFGIIASEWLAIEACYRLSKIRKNRQMKDEIISKRSDQRG